LAISLARIIPRGNGEEINQFADLYVATPPLLAQFGIKPSQIPANIEIITSRTDLNGMTFFDPLKRDFPAARPSISVVPELPTYGSDPTTLITPYGMQKFGLAAAPQAWLIHAPSALTSAQKDAARRAAAASGLVIETRTAPRSFAPLRNWSTAAGILV